MPGDHSCRFLTLDDFVNEFIRNFHIVDFADFRTNEWSVMMEDFKSGYRKVDSMDGWAE